MPRDHAVDYTDRLSAMVKPIELTTSECRKKNIKREKKIRAKRSFCVVSLSSIERILYFNASSVLQ